MTKTVLVSLGRPTLWVGPLLQMTETVLYYIWFRNCGLVCLFLSLEHSSFEFVSDFDIRISYLNTGLIDLVRAD